MSEPDDAQSSTKQRRSRKTNTTSQQNGRQATTMQHPMNDDREAWRAYWKAQGQSWRTEPEIDVERQRELENLRTTNKPDIKLGIYPFKGIKLYRRDIEWLLAKEEGESNLAAATGETQRKRRRLDLRAADLRGENLSGLPLNDISGGLTGKVRLDATREQRQMAGVHMENCNLQGTKLAKAIFCNAYLKKANLSEAILSEVNFSDATLDEVHLEGADLSGVNLQGASLQGAFLDTSTSLEANVVIANTKNIGPQLVDIHWGGVNLSLLDWSSITMLGDEYKIRRLVDEQGQEKKMDRLIDEYQIAIRANRQLAVVLRDQGINEDADWFAYRAQVLKRRLLWKQLHLPIILRGKEPLGWKEQVQQALIDGKKITGRALLSRIPRRVSTISLLVLLLLIFSVLPLSLAVGMILFGILRFFAQKIPHIKTLAPRWLHLKNLIAFFKQEFFAILAILLFLISSFLYSWLASSLWNSFNPSVDLLEKVLFFWLFITFPGLVGLLYVSRIQMWWLQRKVGQKTRFRELVLLLYLPLLDPENITGLLIDWFLLWMTIIYDDLVSCGQYLFSLLLDLLSGYGYKPGRTLFWYVLTVSVFAWVYYQIWAATHLEHVTGHTLSYVGAVIFSITAFHGRGFFLGGSDLSYDSLITILGAVEAVIGLLIELSFIATFTGRFFRR